MNGDFHVPAPLNEPVLSYAPGTPERAALKTRIAEMAAEEIEIPILIGGKEIRTGDLGTQVVPHNHGHVLAKWHKAGPGEVAQAIAAAADAHKEWASWSIDARQAVFLRAAELLAGSWRQTLNAATVLCQSKTPIQAEIDAACELIDFWRFNAHYAEGIYGDQPISSPGMWNRLDYRPLEGFVFAVTPFNFTSIAGNLPTAPAMMGNTVVWKCASSTVYSGYYLAKLFEAAGLPPGVINFVPGSGATVGDAAMTHPDLAGVHFTGSTETFQGMWRTVGENIKGYRSYPRVVGETGGKDFIIAHPSANADAVTTAIVRAGYEYQGQKCSAASRIYIPDNLWPGMKDALVDQINGIAMGDVADFGNFMGAVIDRSSFDQLRGYIDFVKSSADADILAGGEVDDSVGYFIRPTLIQARTPDYRTMCEELFGPIVTLYVYPENEWQETLELVNNTSPYALTGAVFSEDRAAIADAHRELRYAAGNFYINDKPTAAVVGQQPFGGSRSSGTNDKAGSKLNLLRWVSARTIKETFEPPTDYRYPYMEKE
jgi:1-pyrroline-5-carboxylate dehydrogenase